MGPAKKGVFGRRVRDVAIAGRDPKDATTADVAVPDYASALICSS